MLHGFLAAGWNALAIAASVALMYMVIGIPLVFGLLQFAWLLPVRVGFMNDGKTESAKGVLITAGITVLVSAACWASLSSMSFH
jgi:hypothetical protein